MRKLVSLLLVVVYGLYSTGASGCYYYGNHNFNKTISSSFDPCKYCHLADKDFRAHHSVAKKIKFKYLEGIGSASYWNDYADIDFHADVNINLPSVSFTPKTPVYLLNRVIRI